MDNTSSLFDGFIAGIGSSAAIQLTRFRRSVQWVETAIAARR